MGTGPQSGFESVLVRIWGMSSSGTAFFQNVHAQNLTNIGAQLIGIDHELNVGDVIGVQLGDKKARCRVTQLSTIGVPVKIRADVELVEGQQCPWKEQVAHAPVVSLPANPNVNKRRFPRHRIAFPVEMRDDRGAGVPMQTNASDVSGRGCYVETLVPFPLGTPVHVTFWVEDEKISTASMVRASDPGVGMGIEFIGLSLEIQEKVQRYLDRIDPPRGVQR